MCYYYVKSTRRKRENEKQEVLLMVERIIELLEQNHAFKMADRRLRDAFMAIEHVRDFIIPPKDGESKSKLWKKAVQYIADNESRIRVDMQQIEGEDHRVWRWLAPSITYGNQGLTNCTRHLHQTPVSGASVDHSVDETFGSPDLNIFMLNTLPVYLTS